MPEGRPPDLADERLVVLVIPDDRVAVAPARAGVVDALRLDVTWQATHGASVAEKMSRVRHAFVTVT